MLFCQTENYFPQYLYAGVFLSLLFVPSIADKYGRRNIYAICLGVSLVAQFGLIASEQIWVAEMCLILTGFAWIGCLIVGLLYILEFFPVKKRTGLVIAYLLIQGWLACMLPKYFQHISHETFGLQTVCLIMTLCTFCFVILFLPESPYFFYKIGNYQKARQTLEGLLKMNG